MVSTDFDFSDPLNWLLLALITMLLAVQMWVIFKNRTITAGKRNLKIALNLLLWLLTLTFIIQPYGIITTSSRNILVKSTDVPEAFANKIKDSLGLSEIYTQEGFEVKNYDTVTLLGQDFKPQFFAKLSQSNQAVIKRIPYYALDQLQKTEWAAILRKGQIQHISGIIESSVEQPLKIRYAENTLDSVMLKKGLNAFDLKFPVFAQGRIYTNLELGDKTIDTVRFFARPAETKVYQFVLDSPDFETRTLANWLGQNGNSVMISAVLSKNIKSEKTINKAGEPDVFITDPSNSSHPVIKKALTNGKSILLIGLNDAEKDFVVLNNALGSKLNVERVSTGANIPVSEGLTALPFKFASSGRTYTMQDIPVAVTKTNAKIGVSLLNETYPLMLSGDSLAYNRIWTSIMAQVSPADTANIEIAAPIFKGSGGQFHINNTTSKIDEIHIENLSQIDRNKNDTLFAKTSLINSKTVHARFLPTASGQWFHFGAPFQDTEFFVENDRSFRSLFQISRLNSFVHAYSNSATVSNDVKEYHSAIKKPVPDYIWFLLFIFCFGIIWAEPKFL